MNSATGAVHRTTSNDAGLYVFPSLIPGPYRLSVEAPGMQRFEGALTVDVVLKPGQTTTTVVVEDVTPVATTDAPTLGHVLERQRIEQLPINGRFISSLLVTVPGMESSRAYGLREGSQEFVLDGAALSDRNTGGNVRRPPGLDTVHEFKVETKQFIGQIHKADYAHHVNEERHK